jgi:hypothetical protein
LKYIFLSGGGIIGGATVFLKGGKNFSEFKSIFELNFIVRDDFRFLFLLESMKDGKLNVGKLRGPEIYGFLIRLLKKPLIYLSYLVTKNSDLDGLEIKFLVILKLSLPIMKYLMF